MVTPTRGPRFARGEHRAWNSALNRSAEPNPPRIWLGSDTPGPQTRALRRSFEVVGQPTKATLRLFAEARYLLWVNGSFVEAGPAAHHPMRAPFDTHDITTHLRPGANALAVLVYAGDRGTHQHIPSGEPGLCAKLAWRDERGDQRIVTDAEWRVTAKTGWVFGTPKRGWALEPIEQFDASLEPRGWREPGFDDAGWASAEVFALGDNVPDGVEAVPRPTPRLRHQWVLPRAVMGVYAVAGKVEPIDADAGTSDLAEQVLGLAREAPPDALRLTEDDTPGALSVAGLTAERGAIVELDLGAFHVGQLVLEAKCPGPGVIDLAWSEALGAGGCVECLRKGTSYVDRLHAISGELAWRPIGFSGMRYVALVLRGFEGTVNIKRLALDATEPDLSWSAAFDCDDEVLNGVWRLCERTIRVGTQDALMDCPTREQATYIGDGQPVAQWIARLTGDTRYWRDLVLEQFRRPAANGLIRSTPYSCFDSTLIDYNLIAILGTRDYLRWTGDRDTVAQVLPAARRVIRWFDEHRDKQGMLAWHWQSDRGERPAEHRFDPDGPCLEHRNLFIDHPGLGWHNPDDAGIDRRGTNAAIHALLVRARYALADLEDAVGDRLGAQSQRALAEALSQRAAAMFLDAQRGVFVDGVVAGKPVQQVSEQTNTWAALAGWFDVAGRDAGAALRGLIGTDDPALARSGYYFWLYQLEALAAAGRMPEALAAVRAQWGPLLEAGATTVPETQARDHLDSMCHPWSCVPASFLLTEVLGLGGLETSGGAGAGRRMMRPRIDLLSEASGAMFIREGRCRIAWRREGGRVVAEGELPPGVEAGLAWPDGASTPPLAGAWRVSR